MILCGCVSRYPAIKSQRIPTLKVREPVKLTNGRGSTEDSTIRFPNIGHGVPAEIFTVNYGEYTDDALQLLKGELEKKNATVSDSATKEIKLTIVEIKIVPVRGFEAFPLVLKKCILNYKVETRAGDRQENQVGGFGWEFESAIEMAVVEVVVSVLNDENILNYLEN